MDRCINEDFWCTLFVVWSFFSSRLFIMLVKSALALQNLNNLKIMKVLDAWPAEGLFSGAVGVEIYGLAAKSPKVTDKP